MLQNYAPICLPNHADRFLLSLANDRLFGLAGIAKAWDPHAFASAILGYQLVPRPLVPWVAAVFPFIEILSALAILGVNPRVGAISMVVMSSLFFSLSGISLLRGLETDCGCFFGPSVSMPLVFVRSALLVFLSGWLYLTTSRRASVHCWPERFLTAVLF